MHILQHISVKPSLPAAIKRLEELAFNLHWSWIPGAERMFAAVDPELWAATRHNPILMLAEADQAQLDRLAGDPEFLHLYAEVLHQFDQYMGADAETWFNREHGERKSDVIAYFSAEYGLHESLPIYSGGLGILSGDHLKGASDLGLPLVGVGFLYPQGYFHQQIDVTGWQQAYYENLAFDALPVRQVLNAEGQPLIIRVELPGREIQVRAWEIQVGRCTVYLMDTDVEQNSPQDRELSQRLYFGDEEMRVAWETVFGLGGVRLLRALNIEPSVWHMNEGHSAFMGLERVRELVHHHGLTFSEAVETVRANTVFTTHTPVPAGNDTFTFDLVSKYFSRYWSQMGIEKEEFMRFAQQQLGWELRYSMTVLALRLSGHSNGVSKLHGSVSRAMWQFVWPDTPEDEIPIIGLTNGVHTPTWIAPRLQNLFRRTLGENFLSQADAEETWARVDDIPDADLWQTHLACKRDLIDYARTSITKQYQEWGEGPATIERAGSILNPDALIIGFARRFATYKRATLLLLDEERLWRLIGDPDRPVQFVFAGKAHPADDAGKHMIQHLFRLAHNPDSKFRNHIILLEDYDIEMARHLVSGVDVWLNTPRRPHEASGTSGQKAAMCGVPNFSVLDGWWAEGYNRRNGWAIGTDQEYKDEPTQNSADAISLYETLEHTVIPLFFQRGEDGLPREWIRVMKESIRSCAAAFSSRRMLKEYCHAQYFPAMDAGPRMAARGFERSIQLAQWKHRMRIEWPQVSFLNLNIEPSDITVGGSVHIAAELRLGSIAPAEVQVEIVAYRESLERRPHQEFVAQLEHTGSSHGHARFTGTIQPRANGHLGLALRVRPSHPDLLHLCDTGLVTWATN